MKRATVTLRRTIQQASHCLAEAYDAWTRGEDVQCAIDDIEQAMALCEHIMTSLMAAKANNVNSVQARSTWSNDEH